METIAAKLAKVPAAKSSQLRLRRTNGNSIHLRLLLGRLRSQLRLRRTNGNLALGSTLVMSNCSCSQLRLRRINGNFTDMQGTNLLIQFSASAEVN